MTLLETGVDADTLNTMDELPLILAQILTMAENGVASAFGFQVNTGDWHNRFQGQGSNAGDIRDDAIALNQLLLNFLNELANRDDPSGVYPNLLARTTMTFDTEFIRGFGTMSDFSDGNSAGGIIITDPSLINEAGTHGNYAANLSKIAPPTHGNASPSQVEPAQLMDAFLSLSGVTDEEIDEAGFSTIAQADRLLCRKQTA